MLFGDTIAAISSAAGAAARMIVRTSGPTSFPAARRLCDAFSPEPATARFHQLIWNDLAVPAWLYTFVAPHSYTGEDMVEYHLPGNPLLCRILLDELLRSGKEPIRAAEPGEFTARAHFNGKLPLEACEGVAAAIHASNQRELSAARRLLAGELAARLTPLCEMLAQTLALVEAQIDFSDEGISFLQQSELRERMGTVEAALRQLLADSARLQKLAHEPRVLLVGRPNAGKSTLLNALCGTDRAVVSAEAGTTRDVIWATAALRRGIVHIADAAGLEGEPGRPRPGPGPRTARLSSDETDAQRHIAEQMQSHAAVAAERADVLVLVRDVTDARPPIALSRPPDLVVRSKIDLTSVAGVVDPGPPGVRLRRAQSNRDAGYKISAHTAVGMSDLREVLDRLCFGDSAAAESLALTGRHVASIEDAIAAVQRAGSHIAGGAEVLALELREALDAVAQVLGQVTPDDLLGRIFSTFCIGK
jgi:tRNA modification GTPase